ncbi:hypothetical protein AVEN_191808-1 [Araneus ventricosus]|uniref:Uncharacterized protein n=1 Tax=Araneus ventricosus TaxID=182803 RepID=A0A4Y2U856_ARAVE|nr:hypothetical protein AVEN_191808-1 [Araneus ventricosus]
MSLNSGHFEAPDTSAEESLKFGHFEGPNSSAEESLKFGHFEGPNSSAEESLKFGHFGGPNTIAEVSLKFGHFDFPDASTDRKNSGTSSVLRSLFILPYVFFTTRIICIFVFTLACIFSSEFSLDIQWSLPITKSLGSF